MKLLNILENSEYDHEHICLTPGARYSTNITQDIISVGVTLPFEVKLTPEEAKALEVDMHYAIEQVISRLFK